MAADDNADLLEQILAEVDKDDAVAAYNYARYLALAELSRTASVADVGMTHEDLANLDSTLRGMAAIVRGDSELLAPFARMLEDIQNRTRTYFSEAATRQAVSRIALIVNGHDEA